MASVIREHIKPMNVPEPGQGIHNDLHMDDLIRYSPMGIAVFIGEELVVKTANASYLAIIEKAEQEFIGRPLLSVMPELQERGIIDILLQVLHTGVPFSANELNVKFTR